MPPAGRFGAVAAARRSSQHADPAAKGKAPVRRPPSASQQQRRPPPPPPAPAAPPGRSDRPAAVDGDDGVSLLTQVTGHRKDESGVTLYNVEVQAPGGLTWSTEVALATCRGLHDAIVESLGRDRYGALIGDSHFPSRFGLPGTTRRLDGWLRVVAAAVARRALSDELCARTAATLGASGARADAILRPQTGSAVVGRCAQGAISGVERRRVSAEAGDLD
eukprot:TRINITY_DN4435_c0_g1_i4.p1 TRINITY_DN4435_c0_g1~~TRINITY_DN4435_c0_g1_i4.p1  ORF type:complete len:241 (+),score=52.87 TRINITY_DN4435_c0_g1_i4:65-724(+)